MPMYSDDYPDSFLPTGLNGVMYLYLNAAARNGALILSFFGLLHQPKWIFNLVNTLASTLFIYLFFCVVFARKPKNNSKDCTLLLSMVFFILVFSAFGEVFAWQVGAAAYLWCLIPLFVYLIPYRCFSQNIYTNTPSNSKSISFSLLTLLIGIFAGAGIPVITPIVLLAQIIITINLFIKKTKIPLWYYIGIIGFILGFLIVFFSPGIARRAASSVNNNGYMSIKTLLSLPLLHLAKRLAIVYAVAIGKNILLSMTLLLSFIYTCKLPKSTFRNVLFILYAFYLISYLPWIQYLSIPDRAMIGSVLIAITIFCLIISYDLNQATKTREVLFNAIIALISLIYMIYVSNEFYNYHLSWKIFKAKIIKEKSIGNLEVTNLPHTYCSSYSNFLSYPGEPRKNSNFYVNKSIARYYGINKVAVSESAPDVMCENKLRYFFRQEFYRITHLKKPSYLK